MRPIITHQRMDFALLSLEQIVNQAANWHYMFAGQGSIPLVIRLIVGRGWGQGPQHSQSLQSWFAHIPGLKVVMPTTPYDAKGLLIAAIEDNNPVIFIEHRWLHNIFGEVPEGIYRVPLGKARVVREGSDVTIVAISYMTLEAVRAAEMLSQRGVSVEIVDVRSLTPFDEETVFASVRKTGRVIVAEQAYKTAGFSAEITARIAEAAMNDLKCPPRRIVLPDCPAPTTPALTAHYYPRAAHLAAAAQQMLGRGGAPADFSEHDSASPLDIPDKHFTGPF